MLVVSVVCGGPHEAAHDCRDSFSPGEKPGNADGQTRTDGLLITNQLLYH